MEAQYPQVHSRQEATPSLRVLGPELLSHLHPPEPHLRFHILSLSSLPDNSEGQRAPHQRRQNTVTTTIGGHSQERKDCFRR